MKNLYEIMESMNKDETMWDCIRVELNDIIEFIQDEVNKEWFK